MSPPEIVAAFSRQVLEYMEAGGVVMWPLSGLSLVMWCLIIERVAYISSLYRTPMSFSEAAACVAQGQMPAGEQRSGAIFQLTSAFLAARCGDPRLDCRILDEHVRRLNQTLTNRLALIGVLGAIAPLLGLLGTVIGMITTFDVMAIYGTGNAKAMAAGISEALITTQTGLLVAIPGLYMKNFLERRSRNLAKKITSAGLYLQRQLSSGDSPHGLNPERA